MPRVGYLIDVRKNTHGPVTFEDNPNKITELIHCNTFEMVPIRIGGREYTALCDEEGYLKPAPIPSAVMPLGTLVGSLLITNPPDAKGNLCTLSPNDADFIHHHVKCLDGHNVVL